MPAIPDFFDLRQFWLLSQRQKLPLGLFVDAIGVRLAQIQLPPHLACPAQLTPFHAEDFGVLSRPWRQNCLQIPAGRAN